MKDNPQLRAELAKMMLGEPCNLNAGTLGMVNNMKLAKMLNIPPWEVAKALKEHANWCELAHHLILAEHDVMTRPRILKP